MMKKLLLGVWLLSLAACSPEEEVLERTLPISSEVHSESLPALDGGVYYSLYPDARHPQPLSEATVSGSIYGWFEGVSSVAEVRFFLDDRWVDERVERIAPYSLGGDRGAGQLLAYDTDQLSAGTHTLVVRILFRGSNIPQEHTVPFTVRAEPTGQVFYVAPGGSDDNDGHVSRPFKTIGRATEVTKPGDTVRVAPGTYAEAVESNVSGRPGQRITFVSTKKHGAVIDASGYNSAWLNRGSYVDIVDFEVTGSDYLGIYNRGSYVTIRGNHVHHLATPTCNGANGGAGILHGNYEAHNNAVVGNLVHDLVPPGDCSLIHGIYVSDERTKILNNIVYRTKGYGIHTWHAANKLTISGNLVLDNAKAGILVGGGNRVADSCVVTNNIAVHNYIGIREFGMIGQNTYRNNLVWGNQRDTLMVSGTNENLMKADPLLVVSGDEYRLETNSPAVDHGTSLGASEFDYDDEVRTSPFDIGPFEQTSK